MVAESGTVLPKNCSAGWMISCRRGGRLGIGDVGEDSLEDGKDLVGRRCYRHAVLSCAECELAAAEPLIGDHRP